MQTASSPGSDGCCVVALTRATAAEAENTALEGAGYLIHIGVGSSGVVSLDNGRVADANAVRRLQAQRLVGDLVVASPSAEYHTVDRDASAALPSRSYADSIFEQMRCTC